MDSILYVQRRGVGLYLDEATLRAYPARRLDPALRTFIRDHRDEIIAGLLNGPVLDVTVGNVLALSSEEIEEYERELKAASDDRPHIDHDREAWRRAQPILAKRKEVAA